MASNKEELKDSLEAAQHIVGEAMVLARYGSELWREVYAQYKALGTLAEKVRGSKDFS